MKKTSTPLRISVDLNKQLNEIAQEKDISKNKLITFILQDYIATNKIKKINIL